MNTKQIAAATTAASEYKEDKPKRTRAELHYIDALDQIDTELRKARQVIAEFYDEICCNEDAYPAIEDIKAAKSTDEMIRTRTFRLIEEFPRIATLFEVAADHLSEGHMIAIRALCEGGNRKAARSFVIG